MTANMHPRVVCIVDGYSTGAEFARLLHEAGVRLVHVKSRPDIPEHLRASAKPELFDCEFTHQLGFLEDLVASLRALLVEAVAGGSEPGVILADTLAAKLGLAGNSPQTSRLRRDKYDMNEAVRRAGLAAVRQTILKDVSRGLDDILAWNRWPLVVKPASSAGSEAVRFCYTADDLLEATRGILGTTNFMGDFNDKALIQERLNGQQYVVNAVSMAGRHRITEIYRDDRFDVKGAGNIYDRELILPATGEVEDRLTAYMKKVLDAIGLREGASHGEVILTKDGPVLVEVGARLQGGIISPVIVEAIGQSHATVAFERYYHPQAFGATIDERYQIRKHCMVVNLVANKSGVIKRNNCTRLLGGLPSIHTMVRTPAEGARVEKTRDLFTKAGHIYLLHESLQQLEHDYGQIRTWEREEALLEID
jgi:biotin carboxylase